MTNEYHCEVRAHGTRQLELKTRYPVPAESSLRYDLDVYFFTPAQLKLDEESYGVRKFLGDLRTYTRYSTPSIPLRRLVDPSCDISPLTRIRRYISSARIGSDLRQEPLLHELRTLCNACRVEIRGASQVIEAELANKTNVAAVHQRIETYLTHIDGFLEDLRRLQTELMVPQVADYIREAFTWTDESISIITEIGMYELHRMIRNNDELANMSARVLRRLESEAEYRKQAGYLSVADPDDARQNETFLYRESILKKWSQAIMYMSSEELKSTVSAGHLIAAIAAAAAMTFAVVATFLAGRFFPSYSIPWALLIVVAYIFKDRIKEILRTVMVRLMPRFVADEYKKLIDPAVGRGVGKAKELIRFSKASEMPPEIASLRNAAMNPFQSILPEEHVIHFHKQIKLNGTLLQKNHTRLESITEILRLKLDDWLDEMDNPSNSISYLLDGHPAEILANRVYHVHVVVHLQRRRAGTDSRMFHYLLVLTRDGLLRIEEAGD